MIHSATLFETFMVDMGNDRIVNQDVDEVRATIAAEDLFNFLLCIRKPNMNESKDRYPSSISL